MAVEIPRETGPAARFSMQVVIGTFMFSLVLVAAFGLAKLVSWMESSGAPTWMITGAEWAEFVLFGVDLFLFGLFLLSEVLKFVVGLWKEWRA